MSSLKTSFAGLDLKNPIVVSSSSLTDNAEGCLRFEKAGAGAVVLKSLFEEDVVRRTESLTDETAHSESADYLQGYLRGGRRDFGEQARQFARHERHAALHVLAPSLKALAVVRPGIGKRRRAEHAVDDVVGKLGHVLEGFFEPGNDGRLHLHAA